MSLIDLETPLSYDKNTYTINVQTYDAQLELRIKTKSKCRKLFELICNSIGLREIWYFGLRYEKIHKNKYKSYKWLDMNKRLCDIKSLKANNQTEIKMSLLIKYYPESIANDLILDYTQHLFFLQARDHIINEVIYCPAEFCILLASYAAQAKFGDLFDNNEQIVNEMLLHELPNSIITRFNIEWEDKIKSHWSNHNFLLKEEAELEYLKIVSQLEMFGVNYFEIHTKASLPLWLGIDAFGIKIYPYDQKLHPNTIYKWNEINDLVIKSDKLIIKYYDNTQQKHLSCTFYIQQYKVHSKWMLELCIGYHELFIRRRKPESIDVIQMKQQAFEMKLRRQRDKTKLQRERELRVTAERKREELETQIRLSQQALLQAEEATSLLNERVKLAEEETKLMNIKTSKLEAQMNLYKLLAEKKDQEKRYYEFKTAESELILNYYLDQQRNKNSLHSSDLDLKFNSNGNINQIDNVEKLVSAQVFSKLSYDDNIDKLNDVKDTFKRLNVNRKPIENKEINIKYSATVKRVNDVFDLLFALERNISSLNFKANSASTQSKNGQTETEYL